MASSSRRQPGSSLYPLNAVLDIHSHTPCQPFGDGWCKKPFHSDPSYQDPKVIAKSTPDGFVFSKMPRERDPSSFIPEFARGHFDVGGQQHGATLRIIKALATGRAKGAQVFFCEVQQAPAEYWKAMGWEESRFPTQVVAKIFDPLFYPMITPYGGQRLDTVSWADKQYAHEAAAYTEIHEYRRQHPIIDDITANFFGTFSMTHEEPATNKHPHRLRHVRIVLVEYIDGTPISKLCSTRRRRPDILIPGERAGNVDERLEVFARVLHGIVAMEKVGLFYQDLDPSNMLIVEREGIKRVVIPDFNQSRVERYTEDGHHFARDLPRPLHPRWRFGIDAFHRFGGWYPYEWLEYVEPYARGDDDSDTDSYEEEDDGPGRSFTKWALGFFDETEFVLADEADENAEQQDAEQAKRANGLVEVPG